MGADLRWVPITTAYAYLVADDGLPWGWVEPWPTGVRGVVIDPVRQTPAVFVDHPDEPSARAWVESQARPQDETRSGGGQADA